MIPIRNIFYVILGLNCLFLLIFFGSVSTPPDSFMPNTNAFTTQQTPETDILIINTDTPNIIYPNDNYDSNNNNNYPIDNNDSGTNSDPTDKDDSDDEPSDVDQGTTPANYDSPIQDDNSSSDGSKQEKILKKKLRATRGALVEAHVQIENLKYDLEQYNTYVDSLIERRDQVKNTLRLSNPLFLLGAYPKIGDEYFNSYPSGKPHYEKFNYGVINDDDYCDLVDFYNLAHPENMFNTMNFFTDYSRTGLTRGDVIRKIGVDTMRQVSRYMKKEDFNSAQYHLTPMITNFFTKRVDLHIYHTIGKHFNCATQMYNHIPGHGVLKRKDLIVDSVNDYAARFENGREKCFNKETFFPYSYRLYIEEECRAFFNHINSEEYAKSLEQEPLQFVIKLGYGAHRAQGVFIFDKNETQFWNDTYKNGEQCGIDRKSIIAQTYITNPLLLDKHNKFDFRVYMLIASTNPMIVYYHDGFLRVSLEVYDKNSSDKSVHLTNTHLSKDKFAEAEANNSTINGMTAQELRDYQMWTFDRLGDYLYSIGKVNDPKWVENTLRPQFYEAFIHTARMSAHAFWNQSNVYEMFGLDFMLDEDLNLWFIECNSSPQLIGTNEYKTKFLVQMLEDLFEIQYGLYRSRMMRMLAVLKKAEDEKAVTGKTDYISWRKDYAEAMKNRFEPEYEISKNNSFKLIMDMNKEGKEAYFGNLDDVCTY